MFLGLIQSRIGRAKEVWSVACVDGENCNSARAGQFEFLTIWKFILKPTHAFDDLLSYDLCRRHIRLGQDEGQFIAAITCQKISIAHATRHLVKDQSQDIITNSMSIGIVD